MTHELLTDAQEIDCVLRSYPWMDFELHTLVQGNLVLHGGVALDATVSPDILLQFEDVFFVIAPRTWKTDTSMTVLTAHDGSEAVVPLKLPFQVDLGYQIFQLRPEDLVSSCWIAARSVRMTQARPPNVPPKLKEGWEEGSGWMPLP